MALNFEVGDYVWAKMKGFPAWPAKVVEPKPGMKKPPAKAKKTCVYFYGTENYAFILDELIWDYEELKDETRERAVPGFLSAVEALEAAILKSPPRVKPKKLPPVEEDSDDESFDSPKRDEKTSKKSSPVGRKILGTVHIIRGSRLKKKKRKNEETPKRRKRSSYSPASSSASSKKSRKTNGTESNLKMPSHKSIESAIDKL
ncbi:hypothetical protein CAPTEDRAFT_206999, partial [Capitella teleta]